ncbi:MAG TPA: heparinase II/III family protein [Gemmatimonadales bacterium]|nr:heparinase II/III family protein [Gemmatimonadales bacterium]
MLTSEELSALRAAIPADPDLADLLNTLRARARPVLESFPVVPEVKALLSRDGGFCPHDGAPLRFDPWSPDHHRCPRCGSSFSGERHHRHWARAQHLWLAERTAELSLIAAVSDDASAAARAAELLAAYDELYFQVPNRDNVLGPSHLFFSTYLESLWLTSYLAGAVLLREGGLLPPERAPGIDRVAEEAAALLGEFNEGFSNRQTWHSAALTAIAVWFDDLELARTAVESRTGLLGHLADGFGEDGLWWEGENYHLFALRGLMQGIHWARAMGFDLLEDAEVRRHFRAALLGPSQSALPDFTYPARRDSRYGVSLAQPASLELWEIGRAWLGNDAELDAWLAALYAQPKPSGPGETYDAWLHDAGLPPRSPADLPTCRPADLSWWALTAMQPAPAPASEWRPESVLLGNQGLAVLRDGDRYASLECGRAIGGHGHPDRLHLTLHANGIHWLPDQGTGSYVHPSLAWYRSALAHNAPLLDGSNAGGADAWCEAFEAGDEWSWCRGKAGEARRTLVLGPTHLLDLLELEAADAREIVLPWHFQGRLQLESAGHWEPLELELPFVSEADRFVPAQEGVVAFSVQEEAKGRRLGGHLLAPGAELVRAIAPGLPTAPEPRGFLLLRARASAVRWLTVLDFAPPPADSDAAVTSLEISGELIEVGMRRGTIRYRFTPAALQVEHAGKQETLSGFRRAPRPATRTAAQGSDAEALAPRIVAPPALDGTLEGFELAAPLTLDTELQYRRSEEPYDPERFSAQAWVNWDGEALYLAAEVRKPELLVRGPDVPPLELDNEPEDIHSDGLQVYLGEGDGSEAWGFLVVPGEAGSLRTRPIEGPSPAKLSGSWAPTDAGYLVTLRLDHPGISLLGPGARLRFDLLINELQPGRQRRAGQLIWSGGNGWIYLRGDRHDISHAGTLELG